MQLRHFRHPFELESSTDLSLWGVQCPEVLGAFEQSRGCNKHMKLNIRWVFLVLLLVLCGTSGGTTLTVIDVEARQNYQKALEALRRGRLTEYREYKANLSQYPLYPYLEYAELVRKLSALPKEQVAGFLSLYQGTPIAEKMRVRWLKQLATSKQWPEFLRYYNESVDLSARMQCYGLQAKMNTGQREEALARVPSVWLTGESLPKSCDPVFDVWYGEQGATEDLLWERFNLAIENRKRSLAAFLVTKMPSDLAARARLMLLVDRQPEKMLERNRFRSTHPQMSQVISRGLQRLARRDPQKALYEWHRYEHSHHFDALQQQTIEKSIALSLAKKGEHRLLYELQAENTALNDQTIVEWQIRDALGKKEWSRVFKHILQLPESERDSERWRYWYARAIEAIAPDNRLTYSPNNIYQGLAEERGYYGFLAADRVGHNYTINHQPIDPTDSVSQDLTRHPGLQRARELFALGYQRDAEKEWNFSTASMTNQERTVAAKVAQQWGWYFRAIRSAAEVRYWDDLQVRFPLPYQPLFTAAASRTQIEPELLLAIARQESAFHPSAKSSAGALGLMQLMPGTARQTARSIGVGYRQRDLIQPQANIRLGSAYLEQLLSQFRGNRVLATAAYNAGPHRVRQWLGKSNQSLPVDVWIETIPFTETRTYVQRVLSYAVIYGYRLGSPGKLMTVQEQEQTL